MHFFFSPLTPYGSTVCYCNLLIREYTVFLWNSMMSSYCFWMISIYAKKYKYFNKTQILFMNTQKWSKIERPHDLLCWCWWNPGLFGQFLAHFGKKTIQVCMSLPILYRALGDPCDPLQLTTLANKLCNYLINPIVYHSHLYGNLQSGPSKMSLFGYTYISFFL